MHQTSTCNAASPLGTPLQLCRRFAERTCLQTGAVEYPFKRPASRSLAAASSRSKVAGTGPTQAQLAAWASSNLPQQYKKTEQSASVRYSVGGSGVDWKAQA
eukprot:scaffold139052_cov21-Tisochrysis_lutea.AAC.6